MSVSIASLMTNGECEFLEAMLMERKYPLCVLLRGSHDTCCCLLVSGPYL